MSFRIEIRCDTPQCDAVAFHQDADHGYYEESDAYWVDTGFTALPEGWTVVLVDGEGEVRCPLHG